MILKFMRTRYIKDPLGYLIFIIPSTFLYYFLIALEPLEYPGIYVISVGLLSGLVSITAYYFFIYGLHKLEVSRAVTLSGMTPLFTLILATIFLSEILQIKEYGGFFLIIIGFIIISVKNEDKKFRLRAGTLFILLSSFLWSIYLVLLKTISSTNFTTVLILRQLGMLILAIAIIVFSKKIRQRVIETLKEFNLRRGTLAYAAEITGSIGVIFSYLAIQRAPASLVAVLEGFEPLFLILIANN